MKVFNTSKLINPRLVKDIINSLEWEYSHHGGQNAYEIGDEAVNKLESLKEPAKLVRVSLLIEQHRATFNEIEFECNGDIEDLIQDVNRHAARFISSDIAAEYLDSRTLAQHTFKISIII
jgi:predicted PilT family ATPase